LWPLPDTAKMAKLFPQPGTSGVRFAPALLLTFAALLATPAWSFVSTPDYGGPVTAVWNGVGDIVETSGSQCVISTQDKPQDAPGEGKKKKYFVSSNISGIPEFSLHKTDAGNTIPFTLSYLNGGGQPTQIAFPSTSYGAFRGGNVNQCNKMSRFEIFIAEADLRGMPVGTYRATLNVSHIVDNTNETATGTIEVSLRIDAASIALTALDNIDLGSWDGAAASLGGNEAFCVSGTALLYQITASGGAGGFTLSNGSTTIVYEVRFAEGTDAINGQPLLDGITAGAYPLPDQCAGDNTSIYIETTSPLADASAGAYSGQLTLIVEPT
jgi:hypothetical protein